MGRSLGLRIRMGLEIALGLAPITLILAPFLGMTALGLLWTGMFAVIDPRVQWAIRAHGALATVGSVIWIAAALAGVFGVWALTLSSWGRRPRRARTRVLVGLAFVSGVVAECLWLRNMALGGPRTDHSTWVLWLALLVPPTVLGILHLPELIGGKAERA